MGFMVIFPCGLLKPVNGFIGSRRQDEFGKRGIGGKVSLLCGGAQMIDGLGRVGWCTLSETVLKAELPLCRRQALCCSLAVEQVCRCKIWRRAVPAVLGKQILSVGVVVFCSHFCPFQCFLKMLGRIQQVHQADLCFRQPFLC